VAESPLVVLVAQAFCPDLAAASFDAAGPHYSWSVGCIVAASPLVVFKAEAFCVDLAAASFDCAYGYPRSVGGAAIVLPRPNVVLVVQAFSPDLAPASFDAASPHDQWSVGRISIVAESPHVMLRAQAFCSGLAAAFFDCTYGYPRSLGGVAIVLPCPNVMLVAQAEPRGLAPASFDAASPHYSRSVGCPSIAVADPLVVRSALEMTRSHSLVGQRFGRLVVRERAPSRHRDAYWLCECDCGGKKEASTYSPKTRCHRRLRLLAHIEER
jgi:hypothetical protein